MARKNSGSRKFRKEPGQFKVVIGRSLGLTGKWILLPSIILAAYGGGIFGLWTYASQQALRPNIPQPNAIACQWLGLRDVAGISSKISLSPEATLYDNNICREIAASYSDSPWVDSVVQVRRSFPGSIVVDLAIRRPFALVGYKTKYYLVDHKGVRLPVSVFRKPSDQYIQIQGIDKSAPSVGCQWSGRAVSDALRLASTIKSVMKGRRSGLQLASVHVVEGSGSCDGLPQLVAQTVSGVIIDWGSFSESSTYLYPSAREKLCQLQQELKRIDSGSLVDTIVVKYKRPKSTTPPASAAISTEGNTAYATD
jgi:hypothetical protein